MVCAVASLGTNHAKPFGPELQVKLMLGGRCARKEKCNMLNDNSYIDLLNEITAVRDSIMEKLETGSVEESLCKGFTIWYSQYLKNPPFLFIGINPGAGYFNNTGIKYRDSDLEPSDVFEYIEYGGGLASETIETFRAAGRYNELLLSAKINIHFLVTSTQRDLFTLQGILIDKYKINMYEKARTWTLKLIDLINPKCIICEGAYPTKRLAEYFGKAIKWDNNISDFIIKDNITCIGYKRLFSKILNKDDLACRIRNTTL
jgi:hypothetical protein